jgi:hypothetical protein
MKLDAKSMEYGRKSEFFLSHLFVGPGFIEIDTGLQKTIDQGSNQHGPFKFHSRRFQNLQTDLTIVVDVSTIL